jgi:hypothetical protein
MLPENYLRAIRERVSEDQPAADSGVLARFYPIARKFAQSSVRKHAEKVEESANRRLAREQ